ncbi:crinivirus P26 protein [Prevotella intermedia]|uniref:crinivirus P26 protein n=1 Tax=Prevotella intermedia TaxID=28131 RepID=UPI000BE70A57|nr:crinivirus P26 protein [Prevotella intermedia]PDP82042.1 crinivirus P26 protein [Prevotella intermedia]
MEGKKVTIVLEESKYAHDFDKNQNIHIVEYDRVTKLIDNQITQITRIPPKKKDNDKEGEKPKPKLGILHQYNTISIFGGRGSGKTTFILNILKYINAKKEKEEILGIIDPTQMEEKEHVFLVVLSLINKKVTDKIEKMESCSSSFICCYKRDWKKNLSKLAKGLPTLEKIDTKLYENWDDDNYIIDRGLESVSAAYNLEDNFHKLVDLALEIIGKDFFVLAFDDIDVNMSKGWPVLEIIRKYLTTPKLIILLSGNLTLYSYNVRLHQWKQLSELRKFDRFDFFKQVNQLEGQYLLKILKPENRIHLMSLQESKQQYDVSYYFKNTKEDQCEEIQIEDKYTEKLSLLGINNTKKQFMEYLLGLSIRSQISILSNLGNNGVYSQIDAFVSRMMAAKIDVDAAIKSETLAITNIVQYLSKNNFFSHSYLLIPNTEDHDANGCFMGLTTIFVNQAKVHPWILLGYMLRVGYARAFNISLEKGSFNLMLSYAGMQQDMSIKNIVALMIAVGKANGLNMPELIRIKGLGSKSKKGQDEIENLLDSVLKRDTVNMAQKVLALLPLFSLSSSKKQSTELYYSVPILLSTICYLTRWGKERDDIKRCLKDMSLHRIYPMPSTLQGKIKNPEEDIEENEELSQVLEIKVKKEDSVENEDIFESSSEIKQLVDALEKWRVSIKEEGNTSTFPPYLLGRIMTRFTSAIKSVVYSEKLSYSMQQAVILFLNACLVEEAKENLDVTGMSNNNPTRKTDIFENNLSKIKDEDGKKLQLTRWLISCPLLYCFLQANVLEAIKKAFSLNIMDSFLLYNVLEEVNLKVRDKKNAINKKLEINGDNYEREFDNIFNKIPVQEFAKFIQNNDTRKVRSWLLKNPYIKIKSIAEGVTKKLIDLFKERYFG